jgi:hypothetical protein
VQGSARTGPVQQGGVGREGGLVQVVCVCGMKTGALDRERGLRAPSLLR